MKAQRRSRGISLLSPYLGTRWRWVVSSTPQVLCPQKEPWYLLEEAGLALGLVWMGFGEVKILCHHWGWNPGSFIL